MKLNLPTALALLALLPATPALAQDDPATSTAQAAEVTHGNLNQGIFAFTPEIGVLTYDTPVNGTQVRGVLGFGFDLNAVTAIVAPEERSGALTNLYIGPQTGFFFAHTGSASSNFVGSSATTVDTFANAGYMWIPIDLKIGYSFTDSFRLSLHGGGNVVYQTVSGSVNVGNSTVAAVAGTSNSTWNIYPNFGGDVEIGLGRQVSLLVRPDVTIATGTSPFAGTVGVGIDLG